MSAKRILAAVFLVSACFIFFSSTNAFALNGYCAACHTMHNSQDDLPMRFDGGTTPIGQLLRGDCYGCHAMNVGVSTFTIGTDKIPQVFHTGPPNIDLAGGNFRRIVSGGDTKGHNISDLTGEDATLYGPPGGIVQSGHDDGGNVNTENLQCAGTNGCHGIRGYNESDGTPTLGYEGVTGAHHDNWNGAVDPAGDPTAGHGYRFLSTVKGYEDTDWEATESINDHNEYFGRAAPAQLGCGGGTELNCHAIGVRAPNGTISEFCGTCHGNFHTLATGASDGIGSVATSPFIRHPTDYVINPIAGTEYENYNTYDLDSPIARTYVPADGTDQTGSLDSDPVMCLSCHVAHGSQYDDMLRWDYSTMTVGGGAKTPAGCFACHTNKD